jgi:ABC-type glycerol-3-phosphate transport system substrate-binding protein
MKCLSRQHKRSSITGKGKRHLAGGILAATVAATALVPMSEAAAAGPVTVDVVSNFTSNIARGQVLNTLIKEFNAKHQGSIKVVSQPTSDWPSLQAKIRIEVGAGTPPDVFLYNYNPSDTTLEKYGASKLMNWTPYLNGDRAWKNRFTQQDLHTLDTHGDTFAVPDDQSSTAIFYRKDLFAKAGIHGFPATWAEMFADAQKLKKIGVSAFVEQTADDAWLSMNQLSALDVSAGGPNAYFATHLKAAPLLKAASQLRQLFSFAPKDAVGANYAVGSSDFTDGRAAMVMDGPWSISSIVSDVHKACQNVGVAEAPTNGNGTEKPGTIVTDALTVWAARRTSDKAQAQAIVAWMKFYTSPASAALMATKGQFPLAVQTPNSNSGSNCLLKQFVSLSNKAPSKVVNIERYMTPEAQAQLPSLVEALATGGNSAPQQFVTSLEQLNKTS